MSIRNILVPNNLDLHFGSLDQSTSFNLNTLSITGNLNVNGITTLNDPITINGDINSTSLVIFNGPCL